METAAMKTLSLSIITAVALALPALSQAASANDQMFVTKAAQGGMMEVELGNVASNQGNDPSVKDFGQHMVTDHGKANDALKMAAAKDGLTVPDSPSAKQEAAVEKFKTKKGSAFDKAYAKSMVKDHKEDIALFEKEARSGKSPAVKAFAQETLPTLKQHLKMAEEMK